jgi:hypothetical protein
MRTHKFEKQTKIKLTLKNEIHRRKKIATMTKNDNTTQLRRQLVIGDPKQRSE